MLVAFVFKTPFGANAEGDLVQLDPEMAAPLVDAGILAEATDEDVNGGGSEEEEVSDEAPVVTASLNKLSSKIESTLAKATEIALAKSQKANRRPSVSVPATPVDHKAGFKNFGDFANCVVKATTGNNGAREKLLSIKATGLSEGVSADGGYLVPTEYSKQIWDKVRERTSLLEKTTTFPVTTNNLTINASSETSRATGSRWGGLRGYWVSEAASLTASKPTFTTVTLQLKKLAVLVYATSELLEDNQYALETYLNDLVPQEFAFLIDDSILNSGSGAMTGIIGHASTVVVNKESGQSATTLVWKNLLNMYARMYGPSMPNAAWYINQDLIPQLFQIKDDDNHALYIPNNGQVNNVQYPPSGFLFGKPVYTVEAAATLGTVGDIGLYDMSQYGVIQKNGVRSDVSIHLQFLTDETAFRFITRIDGRPLWTSTLTPFKGSATQSPFVTLQTRS